jgi:3alpha(or 20beta)-hydroxysteroid dehydrogenase
MDRLKGKTAIITGAAQGMGAAHALAFAKEGARVILTDMAESGAELASRIGSAAHFIQHDVTDPKGWSSVVQTAEDRFGSVDILVNNAGILGPIARAADFAYADYLQVCAVNQHGTFLGMQAVIPAMIRAGKGSIINISSIAGMAAPVGSPNLAYVGSKFAVRGMTKAAAMEYGSFNIRVNSVHPGYILTPMMIAGMGDETGGEAAGAVPIGRIAQPDEVSQVVLFLASDEASYVTGAEHIVDGGILAQ